MPGQLTRTRPQLPGRGLLKGLAVTLKNMVTPAVTRQYPHEKPDLAPRTRGVIALMDENCTVCMLCAKECPDWCIYIESHKERLPPAREGGRERTRNQLDRFAIDYALCMYCGICVEVCPFDALFWSPEFEYSTYTIGELTHEAGKLREWMDTVPPPPPLEDGAEPPMEVAKALEEAEKARQAALEQARKEAVERDGGGEPSGQAAAATKTREEPEIEVEVEAEVDQDTYDRLIEEGTSERVARARAKAAYVRREKARIREEMRQEQAEEGQSAQTQTAAGEAATDAAAQSPGAAGADTAPPEQQAEAKVEDDELELDIEPGEIDQDTFDALIEEGKSERVARARAKAAAVRKAKARARQNQDAAGSDADQPPGDAS